MSATALLALILATPALGAAAIAACDRRPNLRETATLISGGVLFGLVLTLLRHPDAMSATLVLAEPFPGLPLRLQAEPLGLLFATIASGLWIVTSIYAIGYMRGTHEQNQTRFYVCFAISISATMGVALSANVFSLFVFYEILTLSTYPLVTHKGSVEARRGGRVYLSLLLGTSIGFLLLAVVWTYVATGTTDFTPGGILAGHVERQWLPWLLALYMFGIGKAALMPFHRWLPAAMVAPTPVSALLHAVAVVKAGVFTVLKVTVYIFGSDLLRDNGTSTTLMWVAAATILLASLVAMSKDNLKARLAYSTVSQLAYVTLGAMLATSMGVIGGALQIAMHAMGKITLFFCAGAIYVATHRTEISDMHGLGRAMPFTFAAFAIGALSIIGLPPFGGTWSKWYLLQGTVQAEQWLMIAVLTLSSLLNIAYLMPIPIRAFFSTPSHPTPSPIKEAPLACVVPLCLTALGTLALFIFVDTLNEFLAPLAELSS